MNADPAQPSRIIWATRGRRWGFRFLLDAGLEDPLGEYDRVFAGRTDSATAFSRDGAAVAVRFPDPEGRRDTARRIIPHEFVVLDDPGSTIDSLEAGERVLWPLVAAIYSRIWDSEKPPARAELEPDR